MGNLFGSNDLPAALAYDPDSSAFSDAQKEIWLEYTDGNFVNDISDAIQRMAKSVAALTGSIQARLVKPSPAFRSNKLRNEMGN